MQELQWKSANGCSTCRPALNYYLVCDWPGEYVDDYQSRFINERAHANIQKDGTYSVVPRMWGGLTNAKELRAIADVVDKFNIPTVKVTGGQRIDLLGVKKEQLPDVWRDLNAGGLVSGHAYGKALRTVKTCVGSEWCRFGTQASLSMGVKIEKMTWGSWTPHKVKMAVSGCPRNCAEATIKDFGVVAVDSGWELHVGGNGGIKVRVTDLLCKVETEAEVLEYCGAFMQLYRQEAHYLERTAPWLERVGLDHIREKIVDDTQSRARLYARFLMSQKFVQKDPWAERASEGVHAHEFKSACNWPVRWSLKYERMAGSWRDCGHSPAGRAVAEHIKASRSQFSGPRMMKSSRWRIAVRTRTARLSQGIVHGRSVACPLHNQVFHLDSGDGRQSR